MSAFKIQNSLGEAITINELDKEAAEFWHKEVKERQYANPTPPFSNIDNLEGIELTKAKAKHISYEQNNWFDTIGWHIANPKCNYTSGWDNIKCSILVLHLEEFGTLPLVDQMERLQFANEYVKPYFELIDHWKTKGYKPIQIKE
jgi:hypothetical protein